MKNNVRVLTIKDIHADGNGDPINKNFYSPTPEEEQEAYQIYCQREAKDFYWDQFDRSNKALKKITNASDKIIDAIGKESMEDIMDLIQLYKYQIREHLLDLQSIHIVPKDKFLPIRKIIESDKNE